MAKVLVTGAAGFIGNYVVEELLRLGHDVIASSMHAEKAEKTSWFRKVTYKPLDLHSIDVSQDYFSYFNYPDHMIHLSWEGLPNYLQEFHITENLPAHELFLENMINNGLKDLTVSGTCLEYGMQEGCLKETMSPKPENPYAIAKNRLRIFLETLCENNAVCFKWVRLFYMFGKGQSANSLISQLDKALEAGEAVFNMSGGEQVRDFLPVSKVAEYIVGISLQKEVTGIINCCSGKPVKVKEFVEEYLKEVDKQISLNLGHYPYTTYEPMEFWGDNSKLKTIKDNT